MNRKHHNDTSGTSLSKLQKTRHLRLGRDNDFHPCEVSHIIMVKCSDHYCNVTLYNRLDRSVQVLRDLRMSLSRLEKLTDLGLCRISRSVVINIAHIHRVDRFERVHLTHDWAVGHVIGDSYREHFARVLERWGI